MYFLQLALLIVILKAALGCDNGWVSFEGSCYYLHHNKTTFAIAEDYCVQNNGYLAHIEDNKQNAFLKDLFLHQNPQSDWWIGLSDRDVEGTFRWLDNNAVLNANSFTDWAPHNPSDSGHHEDCVHMFMHVDPYYWNDVSCNGHMSFVCQKRDTCEGASIIG